MIFRTLPFPKKVDLSGGGIYLCRETAFLGGLVNGRTAVKLTVIGLTL